jgi:hypothetical protein
VQGAVSRQPIEEGLVNLLRSEPLDQLVIIDVASDLPGRDDEISFHMAHRGRQKSMDAIESFPFLAAGRESTRVGRGLEAPAGVLDPKRRKWF